MSTHTTRTTDAAIQPAHPTSDRAERPFPNRKHARSGWLAAAAMTVAVGALASCGGSASPTPAASTVVVTQTVAAPAQTVTETVEAPVPADTPETTAAVVDSQAKSPSKVTVPNGVGMNYQDAQDAWRAAGLHVAPANDATGANRIPVLDANWVVLAQDLKPGSKVAADSFITATIKKYTDN
jgi:hypothetical protein